MGVKKKMVRIKSKFFLPLVVWLVCGVAPLMAEEPVAETKNDEGRYKIFIAEHDAIFQGKQVKMRSIFKLDKDTGTVWRYRQGVDSKGKSFEEFFEVPNQ